LTNSLKADYPIAVDFGSSTASGSVNITSNAPVFLNGTITEENGATTITAQGDITASRIALIKTANLTLTAAGGSIGNSTRPLAAVIEAGGVLNAQAGSQGVYLVLNSGAMIGQVAAGGDGDVVIKAMDSLDPQSGLPAGTVNISGGDITLSSNTGQVGTAVNPLVIQANSTEAENGGVEGGIVNASAAGDIGLVQSTGDLLVGTIESTSGDVYLEARGDRRQHLELNHLGSVWDVAGPSSASVAKP
jgi:hypothetical protein